MVMRQVGRVAAAASGVWLAYAWGAHLVTPFSTWRGPRAARRVALTFDDGPDPFFTPRVLEVLAARGVRGTFFLIGERAARAPGIVRAIADGGHEIGNHSWSHPCLWLCGPRRTEEEIGRGQALLGELTGRAPRHFRPPWGIVNAAMFAAVRRHGARCVFWSIQPEGRRARDGATQAAIVVRRAHPGAIVDLHDADGVPGAPARLLEGLPRMLDGLGEAGYELTTVAGLLGDDAPGVVRSATSGRRRSR